MTVPARIAKVGGSLLSWPRLTVTLEAWLARQTGTTVLIAGGGFLADSIRRFDRRFALGVEESHWLCISAMSHTAQLLAKALAAYPLYERPSQLQRSAAPVAVFDCEHFLRSHEASISGTRLPHDWSVSSDSIAARIAEALRAPELVLLKSCHPPRPVTRQHAAAVGYVDDFFIRASRNLQRVKCVNLRDAPRREVVLADT